MDYFKRLFLFGTALLLTSCGSDSNDDIDEQKPVIVSNYEDSFPVSCGTVKKGTTIIFKAKFTDNIALGNYNIDIHHNFDQHNHDTETSSCNYDPKKPAVNPMVFNRSYTIPNNTKEFFAEQSIEIPADIQTGDYHFMIKVTDAAGWSSMRGISFKISD